VTDPRIAIREATEADWQQIWPFYSAIVEDGESYALDPALSFDEARRGWYDGHVVVAVTRDGDVLGTAHCGANRPSRGSHVGTASFMVSPAARGLGVGRMLGGYVVDRLRADGFRAIQFNAVVETNTAAVALWQSLGFRIIGTVPQAFDSRTHGLVGLHVMHLPLT
jgi:L-amino acid N-acyltransferase YncA